MGWISKDIINHMNVLSKVSVIEDILNYIQKHCYQADFSELLIYTDLPIQDVAEQVVKCFGTLEEFRQWIVGMAGQFDNFHVLNSGSWLSVPVHMVQGGIRPNNDGMHVLTSYVIQGIRSILKKELRF